MDIFGERRDVIVQPTTQKFWSFPKWSVSAKHMLTRYCYYAHLTVFSVWCNTANLVSGCVYNSFSLTLTSIEHHWAFMLLFKIGIFFFCLFIFFPATFLPPYLKVPNSKVQIDIKIKHVLYFRSKAISLRICLDGRWPFKHSNPYVSFKFNRKKVSVQWTKLDV